jgi:protein SCO1/2
MRPRIVQIEPRSETRLSRRRRHGRVGAALALAIVATGALGLAGCAPRVGAASQPAGGPGGPFQLVDQNGRPVDQHVLDGKWSVVFFGYTFCPDVCPTTLTVLGQTMNQLGPRAKDVQVVFITVDPARDTPAQLKTYLTSPVFPKNMIALTGPPAQIAQAARDYDVFYQKAGSGPNYSVDHSVVLYLMDPQGRFNRPIAEGLTPEETRRQITEAMSGA